ncbi:hypothetical protein [Vibrio nigripulchritudo]|uniref:hypothetical protein n=1 Tax=Vibrio nigripulchritudo TaxID=28173 RepID=UPI0005FA48CC|nr:hypothetical protein [Vibrio nigripulchritudo]KJY81207.1 hypothetical protein TW74_02675 [Vibrio nigripulchritudo]
MSTHIRIHAITACRQCESESVFCDSTLDDEPSYFVACDDCGLEGEACTNAQAAIDAWNHPSVESC